MLASSTFFKIFPPPRFLLMPHAGLDISDDAITCISYAGPAHHKRITAYGSVELPKGLIDGGDVKDEKDLISCLAAFAKEHSLTYVKVSIPEEKAYLFSTDVASAPFDEIEQNIEFKLEENVPLSATDALFYFDLIPYTVKSGSLRASVSVVPQSYIERYISIIRSAGLIPAAFEVVPKSIARAVTPPHSAPETKLIVHVMNNKTGLYIVSGSVIDFASTVAVAGASDAQALPEAIATLTKEIDRVHSYWTSHGNGEPIKEVILVGRNAPAFEPACEHVKNEATFGAKVADVWSSAFNIDRYLPPISKEASLGYAVAAGLALDPSAGDCA